MTDTKVKQNKFPYLRVPGDKFPKRSGNQVIVRQCSDEILALRELGYKFSAIGEIICEVFKHDQNVLTAKRLSNSFGIVIKGDSDQESKLRGARISKLKEDVAQIYQNLKAKSAFYNKDMSSLNKPEAAQTSAQAVSLGKTKPAQAVAAKPEVKPEAITTNDGTAKPVTSPEIKKCIDNFFLMNVSGRPTGLEKDYVTKYVADHWEELNNLEAKSKGAMMKEVKEEFNSFKKK